MERSGAARSSHGTLKAKSWHESEHYQHGEIDGTGKPVSAGQVVAQGPALQGDCKAQLCDDRKSEGKKTDDQGSA